MKRAVNSKKQIDKPMLGIVLSILIFGLMMFGSAALGVLAKQQVKFYSIIIHQFFFALFGGVFAFLVGMYIDYRVLKKYSFYLYLGSLILTALVFVPHIGFAHGGAQRWIQVFGFNFQPSEFLKYSSILFYGAWLSTNKKNLGDFAFGLVPFALIAGIPFMLLIMQPDTDTGAIIVASLLTMFFVAGSRWRDLFIILSSGVLGLGLLALLRPYVLGRILTFLDPSRDATGASYQLQQSLIAIGSGGVFGRGYGQSIQKFNFLPEPIGDSIFAVIGEELGIIGALIVLGLFFAFAARGFKLARMVKDTYGSLLIVGITTGILVQACINISSMIGIFPLSGIPLPFISHGGTALLTALFGVGIILNVSKQRQNI